MSSENKLFYGHVKIEDRSSEMNCLLFKIRHNYNECIQMSDMRDLPNVFKRCVHARRNNCVNVVLKCITFNGTLVSRKILLREVFKNAIFLYS